MKTFRITYFFLLCAFILPVAAQESAMEQFMAEHRMGMLTADSIDPNHDDLVITALAMQQLTRVSPSPRSAQSKPAAEPAPQPCVLQIDTVNGCAELLSITGQHLADVHFTLVDSTWYMWLSVDPLADQNIQNSPYMYCNGNPIMLLDPEGKAPYFTEEGTLLGTDLDGFSGPVFITTAALYEEYKDLNNVGAGIDIVPFQEKSLSAEAYSKIYTAILNYAGYPIEKELSGGSVSIYDGKDGWNYPSTPRSQTVIANATVGTSPRVTVNQIGLPAREYLTTVENIISELGVHEYEGHIVNGWGTISNTHSRVYKLQMDHPTWSKITSALKEHILSGYIYFLKEEKKQCIK